MRPQQPRPQVRPKRGFIRQSAGSVTMLFGVAALVLMAAIGLAVDVARYYNVASKMQDSMDAAALTGAKLLPDKKYSKGDIKAIVTANYKAAMEHTGARTIAVAPPTVTVDRGDATVSMSARVRVRSFFGPIINQPRLTLVSRKTTVTFERNDLELAMVLDITGSMNAKNKLGDLKLAAGDIIDQLFGSSLSENNVRIGVAPYSASVNAGKFAAAVSLAPQVEKCLGPWSWGIGCKSVSGKTIDTCVVERTGVNGLTDAAPRGLDKLLQVSVADYPAYSCPDATVVPLLGKSQAQMLKSIINGYQAIGATAGHIGTAWGWYLLSPQWDSVFKDESKPEPYGKKNLTKAMLVMTDGLFNTAYSIGKGKDRDAQSTASYAQFRSLCDGAKAKGITIYTVGFDLADVRAQSELQACASEPANAFDAKTGAQLREAFKAIATRFNRLRVAS